MDYKELIWKLKNDALWRGTCEQAADAITDLLKYKDAIDRMGRFGTLFVQYSGDPRGMIGEIGDVESGNVIERAKDMVMHYEMIVDVDMNVWRPVLEDRLQFLIRCMTERAEAAEARCETLEKMVKEYQDELIPGYRERAEKASEIASNLCDDFTDFVTGGVHNAAPYCANQRPECVNAHGWCNGDNSVCRGFLPKAAGIKKEE